MATKKPGQNIQNWQRKTEQVLLRLAPETAARLRELATESEMGLSEYVASLIDLRRQP